MWVSRATYEKLISSNAKSLEMAEAAARLSTVYANQILEFRGELARERMRADNAIDELLAVRGVGPVTPPSPQVEQKPKDFFAEDPVEVQRIHDRMKVDGLMETLLTEVTA
jgi:hypothetical protein